jgi:phage terminase small subunit
MTLTAKQEAFAQAIADGMNQADAYRTAYDAENMADTSVYVEASKLIDNPNVAQRVKELKDTLANRVLWTREMSVKALVQTFKESSGSVKVAAVKELNAMHGYNEPSKLQIDANIGIVRYPGLDDEAD